MKCRLTRWLVCLVCWLAAVAWAEVPVPPLQARVTDLTATLSAEQAEYMGIPVDGPFKPDHYRY